MERKVLIVGESTWFCWKVNMNFVLLAKNERCISFSIRRETINCNISSLLTENINQLAS